MRNNNKNLDVRENHNVSMNDFKKVSCYEEDFIKEVITFTFSGEIVKKSVTIGTFLSVKKYSVKFIINNKYVIESDFDSDKVKFMLYL